MCFREWNLRVQDILTAIATIQRHTANIAFEEFTANEVLVQAVLYNYIIIGEAARNISPEIQALAPEIPWRIMSDMRNVMAHKYFRVNLRSFGMKFKRIFLHWCHNCRNYCTALRRTSKAMYVFN